MLRQITPSLCTQSERHGYIMTIIIIIMIIMPIIKIIIGTRKTFLPPITTTTAISSDSTPYLESIEIQPRTITISALMFYGQPIWSHRINPALSNMSLASPNRKAACILQTELNFQYSQSIDRWESMQFRLQPSVL